MNQTLPSVRKVINVDHSCVPRQKKLLVCLRVLNFEGTNEWLDKWKTRYNNNNVKKLAISGESGDVSGATVSAWKERLPEILRDYSRENVYNLGAFGELCPHMDFQREESNALEVKRVGNALQLHFR